MNITFKVGETPRVYVERIDITGNTTTRDKVIRREFRLNEGDAFNALKVKRSQDRIQSLGFFQEKLEIKQTEGSAPDRVVLGVNVEEKSTGQLSLSGGYSSLERFVVQLAVAQNNFMGKGQSLDAGDQLFALCQVGRARLRRALFPRQADPARRSSSSGATTTASIIIGNQPQHDLFTDQHRRRDPDSASRSPNSGASAPATAVDGQDHARQEHFLHRPRRHRAARAASAIRSRPAAICATKSATA